MYNDKTLREPLVLALHWYRHCNTQSSGKKGSLVLGMASLSMSVAVWCAHVRVNIVSVYHRYLRQSLVTADRRV